VKSDPTLPVAAGTVLTLSCIAAGHQVQGDKTVTCKKDDEFTPSANPECGEYITKVSPTEYTTHPHPTSYATTSAIHPSENLKLCI
jgi:hypothetical protein